LSHGGGGYGFNYQPRGMALVSGVMAQTVSVEFFCYYHDRCGSVALREELLEVHWSCMDRYQAQMVARDPTLAGDGDTPTGSVHIVGLPIPPPPARSPSTNRTTSRCVP
jgi:hypothetical protein